MGSQIKDHTARHFSIVETQIEAAVPLLGPHDQLSSNMIKDETSDQVIGNNEGLVMNKRKKVLKILHQPGLVNGFSSIAPILRNSFPA